MAKIRLPFGGANARGMSRHEPARRGANDEAQVGKAEGRPGLRAEAWVAGLDAFLPFGLWPSEFSQSLSANADADARFHDRVDARAGSQTSSNNR